MSETSSEVELNYLNKSGIKMNLENQTSNKTDKKKPVSTDTDFYYNLMANPEKIKNNLSADKETTTNSSRTSSPSSVDSSTSTSISPTKKSFSNINFGSHSNIPVNNYTPAQHAQAHQGPAQHAPAQQAPTNAQTNATFINPNLMAEEKHLTPQELKIKRIQLLRKLSEIKSKGYKLSKDYDFNSSIEEMEYEYDLLKSFADKQNGIKLYKTFLLNGISISEFLNDKYDPFDFQLSGWSEHMSVEVDNYDDIFEDIYEKYRGVGRKLEPEFKLLFMIASSAAAFHHSKSSFKNIPGLDKIMENNPGLLNKVVGQMMSKKSNESQFMTQQEINLLNEKKRIQLERQQLRQQQKQFLQQQQQQQQKMKQQSVQQSNMGVSRMGVPRMGIPKISAPDNVHEILNKIKNDNSNTTLNDRLMSESTINENDTSETKKRKKGRKAKKKISIST